MKKVQYKDTKFRLIQTMNNMLKVTKKITIMNPTIEPSMIFKYNNK